MNGSAGLSERDWSLLLDMIGDESRLVVPVIGSRLLVDDDGTSSLYARVARRLLADNEIDLGDGSLPPFREINEAVMRLKGVMDAEDIYYTVHNALGTLQTIPTPLRQLAEITDFPLLVTLTPDDLMAKALRASHREVDEVVHAPKLATSESRDLPEDWNEPGRPAQLLYLFGKAKPTSLYAIHDEDALEYAHNIVDRGSNVPSAFLGALQERNLLLIGCNFPDWLGRFLLRAMRKGRLAEGARQWLVDPLSSEDPFVGFLGRYSPKTKALTNVDPVTFVAELHRRWMARRAPASRTDADAGASARPTPGPSVLGEKALFFISYSRATDLERAQRIYAALRSLGVQEDEIWFDRETLEPGDAYYRRIVDGIRSCRYFMPLLSRAATERTQAFVFREWDEATRLLPEMNRRFLVPVVVDTELKPEELRQESVWAWQRRAINFVHAPEGQLDPPTAKELSKWIREARL